MFNIESIYSIIESEYLKEFSGAKVLLLGKDEGGRLKELFEKSGAIVELNCSDNEIFNIIVLFENVKIDEIENYIDNDGLVVFLSGNNGKFMSGNKYRSVRIVNTPIRF